MRIKLHVVWIKRAAYVIYFSWKLITTRTVCRDGFLSPLDYRELMRNDDRVISTGMRYVTIQFIPENLADYKCGNNLDVKSLKKGEFWGWYQNGLEERARATGKEKTGNKTDNCKIQSNPALRIPALYGHFVITDSFLCPWGKPLSLSLNSTRLIRTPVNWGHRTLFSCPAPMNRFSYKVNLANADTLLSTGCCNKPFFWRDRNAFCWLNVNVPSIIVHQLGWIVGANFRLFWHQLSNPENSIWLRNV